MQWLMNFDPQEWMAPMRQWVARTQVLLSAGLGLTGLGMYVAAHFVRRLPWPEVVRSKR